MGPFAEFIPSFDCCGSEDEKLLPSFPKLRPGYVTLYTSKNPLAKYFKEIHPVTAIDCTTTVPIPKSHLKPSTLAESKLNSLKFHLKHKAMKYNRGAYNLSDTITVSG